MELTNVAHAIEAIGFNEECRKMSMNQIYTLLGDTFCRNDMEDIDFVGSISEGITILPYLTNYIRPSDVDYVYNRTEVKLPTYLISDIHTIKVEKDFSIASCPDFPGYVVLKLHKHVMESPYLRNSVFKETFEYDKLSKCSEVRIEKEEQNGPAVTEYRKFHLKVDNVISLFYKFWPVEASKWTKRNKPNNWPSKTLIKQIESKGFNLAPVGHNDCVYKEYQWRIGIRGEKELVLNLNETQMLCYIALRLILKCDKQLIDQDVLSSFHMKNVIFWCAEQESCQWTKDNFERCLKTCINRLLKYISSKQFPHYFIEDRNLINSTMTIEIKKRIVKALTKYSNNITEMLSLSIFDPLKHSTQNWVELLKLKQMESVIERCIVFYCHSFMPFLLDSHNLWETYNGHNTIINLQNAEGILSCLENTKRHFICPYIAYAKNMLGLLYYSRYNKSHYQNDKLKASELLTSSLTFEHVSLKFRVANFFFMENKFKDCLDVCNVFLSNPNIKSSNEKLERLDMRIKDMTTAYECDVSKIYEMKEKTLSIFYDKFISEKCGDDRLQVAEAVLSQFNNVRKDIVQSRDTSFIEIYRDVELLCRVDEHKTNLEILYGGEIEAFLLVFNNFANLVFRDMSFNVPYLASEKWAVPEVIQYELLSVKKCHKNSHIYGIYIDPMLNCLVLTFLCYQETKKWKERDEVLTKMHNYVYGYSFLANSRQSVPAELSHSLPLYKVCNILAHCCVRAGRYRQALNYILYSYTLYRRRKNTASGYIRCVRLYVKEYIMT